jgi:AcrR family transcriptional regulator
MERSFQDVNEVFMSGKPQFDDVAVIAAAIEVFWRRGYSAASISDLTAATGLSRSSLYQRFHDKDGLFQEALEGYTQRVLLRMNSAKADTARGRLKALLRTFFPDRSRPAGCLIGRSCAEILSLSKEGKAATLAAAARQRQIIAGLLRQGIAAGELAENTDIDAMTWYYLGVLQAVLSFPQLGVDLSILDRMIEVAMSAWPSTLSHS